MSGETATGTVNLTAASAHAVNELAGKQVATAGAPVGTVSMTVTVG